MTTQIAVKLPDDLVGRLDALVSHGAFPTRSAAVRAGLEIVISDESRRAVQSAYRDGYARVPETDAELAEAARLGTRAIHDEPWERWW